jgi:hypothetical protein
MKRCTLKLAIPSDGQLLKLEAVLLDEDQKTKDLLRKIGDICSHVESEYGNKPVSDLVSYMKSVSTVTFFGFDEVVASGKNIVTLKHRLFGECFHQVKAVKCVEIIVNHDDNV